MEFPSWVDCSKDLTMDDFIERLVKEDKFLTRYSINIALLKQNKFSLET